MKIALIIIAYLILGYLSVLGFLIFEYIIDHKRYYTLEEFYRYEVDDEYIMLYLVLCIFWPIADFCLIIYFGSKYLIQSSIHVLKYILEREEDE